MIKFIKRKLWAWKHRNDVAPPAREYNYEFVKSDVHGDPERCIGCHDILTALHEGLVAESTCPACGTDWMRPLKTIREEKTRMPVEMLTAFEHNVQALYNYVTDAEGCAGEVAYIIVHLAAKHRMAIKVSDTSVGAQAEGSPGIFVELADHPGETLDMMLQLAVLLAAANEQYSETGV